MPTGEGLTLKTFHYMLFTWSNHVGAEMKLGRRYSREDRKLQIAAVFQDTVQQGHPNLLTTYDVAKALDMAPTNNLKKMMLEMVDDDILTFKIENHRNTWKRLFSLVHVEKQSRNIRINGMQLEMKF
jgi:hypothetical protein